jgi:putative polyhydroxyalkanoate system protein
MRISRSHDLGVDEAKNRVVQVAATLEKQFSLRSEWRDDELRFSGSGVNGQIAVSDTRIELHVRLGFALMMMEGPIRSAIEDALDEQIG